MKTSISIVLTLVSLSFILTPQGLGGGTSGRQLGGPPIYVLRAWQVVEGDSNSYLWSLEDQTNESSTGSLYKSLASPSLRARISGFSPGTKVTLHWGRGGNLDGNLDKEFADFVAFCATNKIKFDYVIVAD
jgi:hypothetical protein